MAQRSVRDYRNTPFYNSVHLMVNVAKQSSPALPLLTCGELAVSKGLTKMSKQQRQGCVCVRPFVGKKKRTIMCHFVLKTEKT